MMPKPLPPLTADDWAQITAALDWTSPPTPPPKTPAPLGPIAAKRRERERRRNERAIPWQRRHKGECVCYFIGGERGPIKIGYATNPAARLNHLQLGSPVKLDILAVAPGGAATEAAYHERFGSERSHREWFNRTPELLAEIEKLNRSAD